MILNFLKVIATILLLAIIFSLFFVASSSPASEHKDISEIFQSWGTKITLMAFSAFPMVGIAMLWDKKFSLSKKRS